MVWTLKNEDGKTSFRLKELFKNLVKKVNLNIISG
jgi:hypothetical protein